MFMFTVHVSETSASVTDQNCKFFTIHSHTEKHTSVHYTHTSHFIFQTLTYVLMQINSLQVIHNDYYTHYSINYTLQIQLDPHGNTLHEFPY